MPKIRWFCVSAEHFEYGPWYRHAGVLARRPRRTVSNSWRHQPGSTQNVGITFIWYTIRWPTGWWQACQLFSYKWNNTCPNTVICLLIRIIIAMSLTRFNNIPIQGKGPGGKWTRKPLAYQDSNTFHLRVTRPPEICVNLVFKHTHTASSYTICRQFVPFIYFPLWEWVLPDIQSTLILY